MSPSPGQPLPRPSYKHQSSQSLHTLRLSGSGVAGAAEYAEYQRSQWIVFTSIYFQILAEQKLSICIDGFSDHILHQLAQDHKKVPALVVSKLSHCRDCKSGSCHSIALYLLSTLAPSSDTWSDHWENSGRPEKKYWSKTNLMKSLIEPRGATRGDDL